MELILKRISDLPLQDAASLTGTELVLLGNNGVNVLVPLSAIFTDAQSQLNNVANLSVVTLANIQDANFTDTYVTYDLLAQAVQSLGILLTQSQQQALLLHLVNYNNPHRVTAEQVGLGNVANLPILTQADLTANNFGNKYITYNVLQAACEALGFNDLSKVANYPPTTLADIQNGVFGQTYLTYNLLSAAVQSLNIILSPMLRTEFLAHLTNYNNPHEVTAQQVGLGSVVNLPLLTTQDIAANDTNLAAYVPYNLLEVAISSVFPILSAAEVTEFLAHLIDYNNPHEVTAEQVGLGNVANLPPITASDINSSTQGDVYLTYNLLQKAIISVGCCTAVGLTIAASTPTYDSIPVTAAISSLAGISLNNMQVTFVYYPTNNPGASTTSSPQPYTNSPSIEYTLIGLKSNTSYTVSAILTNTTNNSINISSNIIIVSTLAVVVTPTTPVAGANQCSFDIIGAGSSTTIVFDSTTVTGNGISIAGNIAIAESDGSTCLMVTMKDPDVNTTIRSLTPQIVYTPNSVGVIPNVGTTTPQIQFSKVATAFNPLGPTFVIAALNPANGAVYYNDSYTSHNWVEVNMVDNLGATLTFSDIALEYDPLTISGNTWLGIVAVAVDANTGIVYYRRNEDNNIWTMLPNGSGSPVPSFSAVSICYSIASSQTVVGALDPATGVIWLNDITNNHTWTAVVMTTSTGGVLNAGSISLAYDTSGAGGTVIVAVDATTQTVYFRPVGNSAVWQLLPTVSVNGNSLSFTHATIANNINSGDLVVLAIDTTGNIYAWNNLGATTWTELPTTDSSGNSITFSAVSFAPDANDSNILREIAIEANTGLPYTRYNTTGGLWTAIPMPSTASTPAANALTTITLATPLSTVPTSGETFQFIVSGVIVEQIIGNTLSYSNGVFTTTSPFAAAPTAVIIGGSRSPVGVIGTGTLAALTVASKTISQGVITEVYNEITGDGASVQIGLNNLYAGDQVIEFDGVCTTKSIIITASLAFDIVGSGSASTTAFDSSTVTGSGISIANNIATADSGGATCLIAPLDAVSGGAFSNLSCEISYKQGNMSISSTRYHGSIGPGTSATEVLYVDQNTGIIYYAQNSYNGGQNGTSATVQTPYDQNGAVQVSPAGLFFKQVSTGLQGRLWMALEKNTGVIYYVYLPSTGISQSIQTWTPVSANGIFFVDMVMSENGTEVVATDVNGNLYYSPTGLIINSFSNPNFGGGEAIYTGNFSISFTQISNVPTLTNLALGTSGPSIFGIYPVTGFIWFSNGAWVLPDYTQAYSSFDVITGNYSSVAECAYGNILLATDLNTGNVYYKYTPTGSPGWITVSWITLPNDGLFFVKIFASGLGQMFIGLTDTGDAYYMVNNFTYTFDSNGICTGFTGNPGGTWQILNGPNHLVEYVYYITSPLAAVPSAGDVFQFVVNGTNIPLTIGSGLEYRVDYSGAYFATTTAFASTPTGIIISGSRGPVGIIGSGALQQLSPSNTSTTNNIITESFTGVPGTGNTLQIGLNNLYAGDQVIEFKGTVTDTSG